MNKKAWAGLGLAIPVLVVSFQNCSNSMSTRSPSSVGTSNASSSSSSGGDSIGSSSYCTWGQKSYKVGEKVSSYVQSEIRLELPLANPDRNMVLCDSASNRREITCLSTGGWSSYGNESCQVVLDLPPKSQAYPPSLEDHIIGMYFSAAQRIPEGAGMAYWLEEARRERWDIKKISESIAGGARDAQEYTFSAGLSNTEFIDQHYLKTFGSLADTAGRDYWLVQMGIFSRLQIHGVINEALMVYHRDSADALSASSRANSVKNYWRFHNRRLVAKYYLSKFSSREVRAGDATYKKLKELFQAVTERPEDLEAAYRMIDSL